MPARPPRPAAPSSPVGSRRPLPSVHPDGRSVVGLWSSVRGTDLRRGRRPRPRASCRLPNQSRPSCSSDSGDHVVDTGVLRHVVDEAAARRRRPAPARCAGRRLQPCRDPRHAPAQGRGPRWSSSTSRSTGLRDRHPHQSRRSRARCCPGSRAGRPRAGPAARRGPVSQSRTTVRARSRRRPRTTRRPRARPRWRRRARPGRPRRAPSGSRRSSRPVRVSSTISACPPLDPDAPSEESETYTVPSDATAALLQKSMGTRPVEPARSAPDAGSTASRPRRASQTSRRPSGEQLDAERSAAGVARPSSTPVDPRRRGRSGRRRRPRCRCRPRRRRRRRRPRRRDPGRGSRAGPRLILAPPGARARRRAREIWPT